VVLRHHRSLLLLLLLLRHAVEAALSRHRALSKELMGAVGESAAVAPRARAALEVHAHLRLALVVVDSDTARAGDTAATATLTEVTAASIGNVADVRRQVPVRGLGVVVDVVHLTFCGVGDLPARGQLGTSGGVLRVVAHDCGRWVVGYARG